MGSSIKPLFQTARFRTILNVTSIETTREIVWEKLQEIAEKNKNWICKIESTKAPKNVERKTCKNRLEKEHR